MGSDSPSSKRHHPFTPRRRLTTPQKPVLHPYPSLQTLLYCLCSCDFDREIVIFINFLKISLSNVVSRTNFLPLRSGQKEMVYYPEAFSSWYTIMFAFCSEAKCLAKSFQQWAVLMSDFRGRRNSIVLVSLKKAKSCVNSVTNPLNVLLAHVSMWLWEEGDLSLTFLTPWGVSCWTQWGPWKTLMGMEPDHMASAAVLLLCSSSQKTLLPSYLGALVNLFPTVYLWRKEHFQVCCVWGGSGTGLSPIQGQVRLIFPPGSTPLALLYQCLLPSFLQRILCKCLQFEHDLLIRVAQSHIEYLGDLHRM